MKEPYNWDNNFDQPSQLKDKNFKKQMRKKEIKSLIKTIFTSIFILPFSLIMMPFVKRKTVVSSDFFGMAIDYTKEADLSMDLLKELDVSTILLRFKLWEMDSLKDLKDFILKNKEKKIILKIMQDREHVKDLDLLQKDLNTIFSTLGLHVGIYEIGTTINRAKWGFFSVDEYNKFFKTAYDLKESKFPSLQLIGSGVIDFEYHFTAHTIFNFYKYSYDGVSSLLYVDRRGAPENTQLGFNLSDKIAWLSTMVWLSPKTKQDLHITEVNWPLSGTAPYAPTSEYECVNKELYADYMLRYNLLTFASQQVNTLSWHQLIAPGYGLVDNRDKILKHEAFYTYKFMLKNLKNAQFLRLDIKRGYYILQCLVNDKLLQIHWSLKPTTLIKEDYFSVFTKNGKEINDKILQIGSSPIYINIQDAP